MKTAYKVILIAMSGVRVYNQQLFNTGLTLPGFVDRSRVIASLPSLGLLSLAAHTPENWEVVYKELDTYSEDDITEILNEKPNIIAISSLTARIYETYKLSAIFRKNGITVVIGGLHVSVLPDEAKEHADVIVQGEGEICWEALLRDYENNSLKPLYSSLTNPKYVFHLKDSKVPRYDLLNISNYNRLTIQTTRGCPHQCNFCAASKTISSYKKKPIKLIKKDMQLKGDVCYFSSDTDDTRYPPSPKSCQLCFIIAPKSQLLHSSARAIGLAPRCTQRYCKTKGEAP